MGLIWWARPFNPPEVPADTGLAADQNYKYAKNGLWAVVYAYLSESLRGATEHRLVGWCVWVRGGGVWGRACLTARRDQFPPGPLAPWHAVISTVQGPDTKMIRPHPAFWKFVFGLAVLYTLCNVYLLFQTADGARQTLKARSWAWFFFHLVVVYVCWLEGAEYNLSSAPDLSDGGQVGGATPRADGCLPPCRLQHLYPELGVPLDERAYGVDCSLYKPGTGINWQASAAASHALWLGARVCFEWGWEQGTALGEPEACRVSVQNGRRHAGRHMLLGIDRPPNTHTHSALGPAQILKDTLFDEFVLAHILGWWGKTLMLRDRTVLWIIR